MAQLWKDIGEDMEKGQNGFPATFGDKMRRIDSNFHQYRAAEWRNWNDYFMPILLFDRLPPYHYQNLVAVAEAMSKACSPAIKLSEIDHIQQQLNDFIYYYETNIYKYEWEYGMRVMRSTIHTLCHVTECIKQCGPMRMYWQYPMERIVGLVTRWVHSRDKANKNLDNIIFHREQHNHLKYCVLLPTLTGAQLYYSPLQLFIHELKRLREHEQRLKDRGDTRSDYSDLEAYELMSNAGGSIDRRFFDREDSDEQCANVESTCKLLGPNEIGNLDTHIFNKLRAWRCVNVTNVRPRDNERKVMKSAHCVLEDGTKIRGLEML